MSGDSIEIAITTIDSITAVEGLPALIKIDVEGHEAKVFSGAWDTIHKAPPLILFESFVRNPDFLSKLNKLQYLLFDADYGGHSTDRTTNYVAVQSGSPYEAVVGKHLVSSL